MDRLDAIKIFVRVVESGSFSAVARELGVGQPAVSKQVISASLRCVSSRAALMVARSRWGYTDVELQAGHRFHAILEAKRWWDLPSIGQLKRYLPRLADGGAERQCLISVSAADRSYALHRLPAQLEGVGICHLSWRDLQTMARKAQTLATGSQEKLWLRQLIQHLQEFTSMERQTDNKVFVVALGQEPMVEGQTHTWIDVVEKDHCYFHPIGNNWPVQPPNYIAFRYRGRLQSVNHIDSFEIVQNLAAHNPLWLETDTDHFVYRLGPPSGRLVKSRRATFSGMAASGARLTRCCQTPFCSAIATSLTSGASPNTASTTNLR